MNSDQSRFLFQKVRVYFKVITCMYQSRWKAIERAEFPNLSKKQINNHILNSTMSSNPFIEFRDLALQKIANGVTIFNQNAGNSMK